MTAPDRPLSGTLDMYVSDAPTDAAWDKFLAGTPGGHHAQSSSWARLKATVGWDVLRVTARRGDVVVGGAQLLVRSAPVVGSFAYMPKGPLLAADEHHTLAELLPAIHEAARSRRIRFLAIQPPDNGAWVETKLSADGFRPSPLGGFPTATVTIDLSKSLDDILAAMKSKTRYNVRLSQRKGIQVRVGSADDLPSFYSVLRSTGERQDFSVNDESYYAETARIFGIDDGYKLFLAEYEGEVASAMFAIAFGDTVLFKRGGWTGRHGALRPNEAMHWAAIRWAKDAGYRYYNFEGIDPTAAERQLAGEQLDSSLLQSVTRFKLGFGGEVRLLPGVHDDVYNPVARWGYRTAGPRLRDSALVDRVLDFVRSR
ncbi:MAG: peptidoglycan bridge formation glycyltransferase FemA/FemB family protein [Actinomycetota bacterium]